MTGQHSLGIIIIGAFFLGILALCSCRTNNAIIPRSYAVVVQATQSLAPRSEPPGYKTDERIPGQECSIVLKEGVPARKFEYYEIQFQIVKIDNINTSVAVEAYHINLLPFASQKREKTNRIAKRYAKKLETALKTNEPHESSTK